MLKAIEKELPLESKKEKQAKKNAKGGLWDGTDKVMKGTHGF